MGQAPLAQRPWKNEGLVSCRSLDISQTMTLKFLHFFISRLFVFPNGANRGSTTYRLLLTPHSAFLAQAHVFIHGEKVRF